MTPSLRTMKPVPVPTPEDVMPKGDCWGSMWFVIVMTAGATSAIAATTGSPLEPEVDCCKVVVVVVPDAVSALDPDPHDTLHAEASRAVAASSGTNMRRTPNR